MEDEDVGVVREREWAGVCLSGKVCVCDGRRETGSDGRCEADKSRSCKQHTHTLTLTTAINAGDRRCRKVRVEKIECSPRL